MCRYWPKGGSMEFGPLIVEFHHTRNYEGVALHTLSVRDKGAEVILVQNTETYFMVRYNNFSGR